MKKLPGRNSRNKNLSVEKLVEENKSNSSIDHLASSLAESEGKNANPEPKKLKGEIESENITPGKKFRNFGVEKNSKKMNSKFPEFKKNADGDRRIRQSTRMARVLSVLSLIQSRARWNVASIAAELECSQRTIFRDLDVLQYAGIPWYYCPVENCYRVREDFRFPTLALTEDEVLGQVVATALSREPASQIGPGATATTRKLMTTAGGQMQQLATDAARLIDVFSLKMADHSRHYDVIKAIQFALLNGRQLSGVYHSPYETGPIKLKLHPYRLCLIKQAWYVIGRPCSEDRPLTFRVVRFKSLIATEEPAQVPDSFCLKNYLGNAWAVYRGDQAYQIVLHFEAKAAKVVVETLWHSTQQAKWLPKGRLQLTFTVDGLDEIIHWILSWADQVTVVEPEVLKLRLVDLYGRSLEKYKNFSFFGSNLE